MTSLMKIVAVGARTPLGLTAASSAAAVRGEIARLQEYPYLVDNEGGLLCVGADARLAYDLPSAKRLAPLLATAFNDALSQGPADILRSLEKLPLLLVLPENRPGFSDKDAQEIFSQISAFAPPRGRRGACPELKVEIAGRGHAGAFQALEMAARRLAKFPDEVLLIAGVDSFLDATTLAWLDENRQLVRAGVRNGFHPGEAAGVLLLTGNAVRMSQSICATVRGVATSQESKLIKGDSEGLGEGLTRAIAAATSGLRLPEEAIDTVYCDINGERYRTEEWGFAALRAQKVLRDIAYQAPAGLWGDIGAASGVLGIILAVRSWARQYAKGPRALVWASSEGGLRGAAVLEESIDVRRTREARPGGAFAWINRRM